MDGALHGHLAKLGGGFGRAGDEDGAAGFAIEAVDEGHEFAGEFFLGPAEKRGFAVGTGGMREEMRGLGDDEEAGFFGDEKRFSRNETWSAH